MKLHEEYKDLRDRFEILAFHDKSAPSFQSLDPRLKELSEKHWKGAVPAFPILLDASGETVRSYGIRAFPTSLLIDPDGRLVTGNAAAEKLAEKLQEIRKSKDKR